MILDGRNSVIRTIFEKTASWFKETSNICDAVNIFESAERIRNVALI